MRAILSIVSVGLSSTSMTSIAGYHNFLPPCLCKTDICEPSPNCTAFCPWTYEVSQTMMANAGVSGTPVANLVINNTDSFHDVWETQPSVHLPKVGNRSNQSSQLKYLSYTTLRSTIHAVVQTDAHYKPQPSPKEFVSISIGHICNECV
jgi:hypothetical protein